MARPGRAQDAEIGRLEDLAACNAVTRDACNRIVLRLEQTARRITGNVDALHVMLPIFEEVTDIVNAQSQAFVIVAGMMLECREKYHQERE